MESGKNVRNVFFVFVSCLPEDILKFKADMAKAEMPRCLIGIAFIMILGTITVPHQIYAP